MSNRVICLFTTACLTLLLLSGCGAGGESDAPTGQPNTTPQTTSEVPATTNIDNQETPAQDENKNIPGEDPSATPAADSFVDANDMFESANLIGLTSNCTDSGCVVSTSLYDGDSSFGGGDFELIYADAVVFQKSNVASNGSTYTLEDCNKSDLKDGDYVLVFGSKQDEDTYLAEKIISVKFNY